MSAENEMVIALCWFDREQWEQLALVDPEGVDNSYEDWKKGANRAFSNLTANGQKLRKISIRTSDLIKWCQENDQEPNSSARSKYAAMVAQKRYDKKRT